MKIIKKQQKEQAQNKHKKSPIYWETDTILNQLAEVIYHSYFKKYPHELQKIVNAEEEINYLKAA